MQTKPRLAFSVRNLSMHAALLPSMATAILALAVCAPSTALAQNAKQVSDIPLDFDPARPERVDGWWSNGVELMRLDANGAYRVWVSQDRFKRPVEVGAWRRNNYVFFDLEPYRVKTGTRHRVTLQKDDGVTELHREGMTDFRWLATPPHIPADDMLGAWVAATEELLVFENGRYEWRRTGPATGITEHSGIWNSEGDVLTLAPDTPAVDTISARCVKGADGQFTLETAGGKMTHPPTEPQPTPTAAKPDQPKSGAAPSAPAAAPGAPVAPRAPAATSPSR